MRKKMEGNEREERGKKQFDGKELLAMKEREWQIMMKLLALAFFFILSTP
jgi:hypothetical protein